MLPGRLNSALDSFLYREVIMRILMARFAIALFAFLTGVGALVLWNFYYVAEEIPLLQAKPNIPAGWHKVEVAGKFSFFLPPDMKKAKPIGCSFEPGDTYANDTLLIGYAYGEKISCAANSYPVEGIEYKSSEVTISGRRAMLEVWTMDSTHSGVTLCIPDIGDGKTVLALYASPTEGERAWELASKIFNSTELR